MKRKATQLIVLLGTLLISFGGCQSLQLPSKGESTIDRSAFMALWEAYSQCQSSRDPSAMQTQLVHLQEAPSPVTIEDSPIPLPRFLTKLASKKTISRLAVDPKAMAASCALQTGRSAVLAQQYELAMDMFRLVMANYSEPQYAYYMNQARQELSQVPTLMSVSTT